MRAALWVAARIVREIVRDKRTLVFLFAAPIVVMTLIYYAIAEDEVVKVGVVSRGMARLFDMDFVNALEEDEDVEVVYLDIDDTETDHDKLIAAIRRELMAGRADGVLYLPERLLVDRFNGLEGTLTVYVEGTKPIITADVMGAIADAMDELAERLPVVIDASCSSLCAESVNNKAMEMEKTYLYGSDDYRLVDYFLPVLPPFFVFFFTFIISTITFQRERLRGTLERLQVAPLPFRAIITGYVGGFMIFTSAQSTVIVTYILALIQFEFTVAQVASLALVIFVTMLVALNMGLLASFLAHNEFQALQFIPLIILPQVFLSDMIWDIERFPTFFKWLSYCLPLTHANAASRHIMIRDGALADTWPQILFLLVFMGVINLIMTAVAHGKEKRF